MHPDLISIGFLHVKTYGACMALGFLAAWQVVAWLCGRTGRKADSVTNLMLAMIISGVVGSRIAYVIEHWQAEFAADPFKVIRVDQGGLMFYGGLILSCAVFVVWCLAHREPMRPLSDMLSVVLPLGHAFGRVGCFFYGCCYGKVSDCALAVRFPGGSPASYEQSAHHLISSPMLPSLPVLPTQLFEAAAVLVLFAVLLCLYLKFAGRRPGFVTGCYLAGYACVRFGIEVLRGDPRAAVGPFSISQTISIGLLLFGTAFIAIAFRREKQ